MIDRYTRPGMGQIWTLESQYQAWLAVELAVVEAWLDLGVVDAASVAEIREKARVDAALVERIQVIEETTRHEVIAFLTALEERVGPASRFIHLGCTSSDIIDTANALLLVRAGELILAGFDRLLVVLKSTALAYKGRMVMGRTHGVHAEPTSFGLKMAGFHAEFERHRARFAEALKGVAVGKISGAVGTFALVDPEVERLACARLGLAVDPVSTQIIQRDRYAHYFTSLALAAGGIERLGVELRHLQRTEVLEVEEGFSAGQKGSSAMPHKKNPITSEKLVGLSRLMRGNALAAMENMALWHERDISHSSVERVIMPDSTILMDYSLHLLANLVEKLRVIPENMERNLHASYDLFYSQRVLTALIDAGLPRQEAYALVQRCAMKSWESKAPFPDLIRAEQAVFERLGPKVLETLFDPTYYLRYENMIFDRVFKKS